MSKQPQIGYWQLVSQSMDLEDQRLQMFVRHNASLGTGRENIVRKFLAEQTPEPYRVSTGFVVYPPNPDISSAQCDVLVYDPRQGQPVYRIEEFVVVSVEPARLAIEVRSDMAISDDSGLDQVFHVHDSMRPSFGTQVFGFGFDGPLFGTFLSGIISKMKGDPANVPECILVSRRNYVCIRVENFRAEPADRHFCVGMDFSQVPNAVGYATAMFLWCYHQRIEHNARFNAYNAALVARDMGLSLDKLKVIRPNGVIEDGYKRDAD